MGPTTSLGPSPRRALPRIPPRPQARSGKVSSQARPESQGVSLPRIQPGLAMLIGLYRLERAMSLSTPLRKRTATRSKTYGAKPPLWPHQNQVLLSLPLPSLERLQHFIRPLHHPNLPLREPHVKCLVIQVPSNRLARTWTSRRSANSHPRKSKHSGVFDTPIHQLPSAL